GVGTSVIAEPNMNNLRFDMVGQPVSSPVVFQFTQGPGFQQVGDIPVTARPQLRQSGYPTAGPRTSDSWVDLTTADIDGDGLLDLLMQDGHWVGYSPNSGTLVVK